MQRPAKRRALPDGVFEIQSSAALDEQPNHRQVPHQRRLMQWRRMRVRSLGVESIRIFTRIKQQPDDVDMAMLRRQRKGAMAVIAVGGGKQTFGVIESSKPRRRGKRRDSRAALNQCLGRGEISVR